MIRRPPRSTRTDTLFPYTTLFRSLARQRCVDLAERLQREINVLRAHADTRVGNLDTNAVPVTSDSDGHFARLRRKLDRVRHQIEQDLLDTEPIGPQCRKIWRERNPEPLLAQIGRASCRERVCQYV